MALSAVAFLAAAALAKPTWRDLDTYTFPRYVHEFHKGYQQGTDEWTKREKLFEAARQSAMAHNKKGLSWKEGINRLSDRTPEELKAIRGVKANGKNPARSAKATPFKMSNSTGLPEYIDWRLQQPKVVTGIKDQGMCGDCWAHGATEAVETHAALKTGQLFVLSQQQVTSCPKAADGCGGGFAALAYEYLMNTTGQTEEWEYPFTSYYGVTGKCAIPAESSPKVKVTGYVAVTPNSPSALQEAIAYQGPLSIAVAARTWMDYESGVYDGCSTSFVMLDHVVNVVGYGTDAQLGVDYWLIRNSWSASWGEDGYMRLRRHTKSGHYCALSDQGSQACGECGIEYSPLYPLVDLA